MSISLRGVTFSHRESEILRGVTLDIPSRGVTCILGPNGSGKTTLVRIISGELRPTSGIYIIDGKDSAGLTGHQIAGHFAFIPQDVQTPAYLTVTELLELARFKPRQPFWRQASSHDLDVVMKCERLYGLERFSARQVESLSGGEVQRAWLAFALAQEKPFLLLDEALDALDTRARRRCFQTLKEVAANGRGVLLITHELALAQEFADLAVVLEKGEVIFFGAPDAALAHRLAALAE